MGQAAQEIDNRVSSYVAVDLETTGLDPKQDRIIELGAVRILNGVETDRFSSFVNPKMAILPNITELTGITDDMVKEAPAIEDLIEPFLAFVGQLPILGHHVIFDYSFLKRAAVNRGLTFEKAGIDTLALCRSCMPEDEKKNLAAACRFFNIKTENAHRALDDALAAHLLYQALVKCCREGSAPLFCGKPLIYKVKKEQPATKKQKQGLRDLTKYHKISLSVQIDSLTRNEASRLTDKIILQYGRIKKR